MVEYKVVIGLQSGKTVQKEIKDAHADALHDLRIGETISGDKLGFAGYEFQVTGGSDKCGFPMRKGIQEARKKILMHGGVGFSGLNRNGQKQKGLVRRRTVCGERITKIIHQVNLKATKEGPDAIESDPSKK
ncbi:30S ribosomal protein S6e [Candidatus Woesearchaeota archaeon]|nr:30S ribosomal protein S6e [Candidatus Woesearchaeota archaeon]